MKNDLNMNSNSENIDVDHPQLQREVFNVTGVHGVYFPDNRGGDAAYRYLADIALIGKDIVENNLSLDDVIAKHRNSANQKCVAQGLPLMDADAENRTFAKMNTMAVCLYRTFKKLEASGTYSMKKYIADVNSLVENGYDQWTLICMFVIQYGDPVDQIVARKHLACPAAIDERLEKMPMFATGAGVSLETAFVCLAQKIMMWARKEVEQSGTGTVQERLFFVTTSGKVLSMLMPRVPQGRDQLALWLKYFIQEHGFIGVVHVMHAWVVKLKDTGDLATMVKDVNPKITDPNKQVTGEVLEVLAQAKNGFARDWKTEIAYHNNGKLHLGATAIQEGVHGRFAGLFDV